MATKKSTTTKAGKKRSGVRTCRSKPGKTSAWWNNYLNGNVDPGDWKENFRMCEKNFQKLCDELRPFITGKETAMVLPVSAETKIALYYLSYLSDAGRIR